jgi:hypothetical protein
MIGDGDGHDGGLAVNVQDDIEPVGQGVFFEGNGLLRGCPRWGECHGAEEEETGGLSQEGNRGKKWGGVHGLVYFFDGYFIARFWGCPALTAPVEGLPKFVR